MPHFEDVKSQPGSIIAMLQELSRQENEATVLEMTDLAYVEKTVANETKWECRFPNPCELGVSIFMDENLWSDQQWSHFQLLKVHDESKCEELFVENEGAQGIHSCAIGQRVNELANVEIYPDPWGQRCIENTQIISKIEGLEQFPSKAEVKETIWGKDKMENRVGRISNKISKSISIKRNGGLRYVFKGRAGAFDIAETYLVTLQQTQGHGEYMKYNFTVDKIVSFLFDPGGNFCFLRIRSLKRYDDTSLMIRSEVENGNIQSLISHSIDGIFPIESVEVGLAPIVRFCPGLPSSGNAIVTQSDMNLNGVELPSDYGLSLVGPNYYKPFMHSVIKFTLEEMFLFDHCGLGVVASIKDLFSISTVSSKSLPNLRIQGRKFKLGGNEGSHVVQNVYDSLEVYVCMWVSVLVTLDQPTQDNYVIAYLCLTQAVLTSAGVLHYTNFKIQVPGPMSDGLTDDIEWSTQQAITFRWNLTINAAMPNSQCSFGKIRVGRTKLLIEHLNLSWASGHHLKPNQADGSCFFINAGFAVQVASIYFCQKILNDSPNVFVKSAYETLNEVVRCLTHEIASMALQLIHIIMTMLHKSIEAHKLPFGEREKQNELLPCGCLQVIIQKLGIFEPVKFSFMLFTDHIMDFFLCDFSCRSASVHQEAMLAMLMFIYFKHMFFIVISSNAYGSDSHKYLPELSLVSSELLKLFGFHKGQTLYKNDFDLLKLGVVARQGIYGVGKETSGAIKAKQAGVQEKKCVIIMAHDEEKILQLIGEEFNGLVRIKHLNGLVRALLKVAEPRTNNWYQLHLSVLMSYGHVLVNIVENFIWDPGLHFHP